MFIRSFFSLPFFDLDFEIIEIERLLRELIIFARTNRLEHANFILHNVENKVTSSSKNQAR